MSRGRRDCLASLPHLIKALLSIRAELYPLIPSSTALARPLIAAVGRRASGLRLLSAAGLTNASIQESGVLSCPPLAAFVLGAVSKGRSCLISQPDAWLLTLKHPRKRRTKRRTTRRHALRDQVYVLNVRSTLPNPTFHRLRRQIRDALNALRRRPHFLPVLPIPWRPRHIRYPTSTDQRQKTWISILTTI